MSVEDERPDSGERLRDVADLDGERARTLLESGITADDLLAKSVTYRELVDAGLDEETALRLRRDHSLSWSADLGDDLTGRSENMRTLGDDERTWISASDGDWEDLDHDYDLDEREAADVWADRDRPTPVTAVPGVGEGHADALRTVGVTSVKQLSWIDAGTVADLLDLDVKLVRLWRHQARQER